MSSLVGADLSPSTIKPVDVLFRRTTTALWATTYTVDLGLFNEFLLPRLGAPPLNAVVLTDRGRLNLTLERIPRERVDALAAVNRRWLLRGVQMGKNAFHPKTYLAVTPSRATLLIGSGNLSTKGLDEGHEVFTEFRSDTAAGRAAIATWRAWMRRTVETVGDRSLARRFHDLEERLGSLSASALTTGSAVLHNLDQPLAAQLVAAVREVTSVPVDELWLAAPFYDDDTAAVAYLVDRLEPRTVQLFVTHTTNVNGKQLVEQLVQRGAETRIWEYKPDAFVHAKLIGVVAGSDGWLLSGSGNLSRAALTSTPAEYGNVEADVLAPLDPQVVQEAFNPPDLTVTEINLDRLSALQFHSDPDPEPLPVRLVSAVALEDGRVEVETSPATEDRWLLDDLVDRQPLVASQAHGAVTAGPLAGRLVQVVGSEGRPLSNRAVVDDPVSLAQVLMTAPNGVDTDRPSGLTTGDVESPLGEALTWLNRNLVLDVSERDTASTSGTPDENELTEVGEEDFWTRLEKEELASDPRAGTYARLWKHTAAEGPEPIMELLEVLRGRTPPPQASGRSAVSLLSYVLAFRDEDKAEYEEQRPIRRWRTATRIRVRARNVLRRWAAAQTDPRLSWVDPLAPAGNFVMITATLARLRLDQAENPGAVELTNKDLDDLWGRWLTPFVGTGEGDGWLDQLDPAEQELARERLRRPPPGAPFGLGLEEAIAALSWLTVRPGPRYRERVISQQAVLSAALHYQLIEPTETTAEYVSAVVGSTVTREAVDAQLLRVIEYVDDELWCSRAADELGLEHLTLEELPGAESVQVRLGVGGIPDPLADPRVPRLAVAARRYRRCDGVSLFSTDADWRLAARTGERLTFLPSRDEASRESMEVLDGGALERLAASSGILADWFSSSEQVA